MKRLLLFVISFVFVNAYSQSYLDYLQDADPMWKDTLADNYTVSLDISHKVTGLKDVFADSVSKFWTKDTLDYNEENTYYSDIIIQDDIFYIDFEKYDDYPNWDCFNFIWGLKKHNNNYYFGINGDTLGGQVVDFKDGVKLEFEYQLDIEDKAYGNTISFRIDLIDANGHVSTNNPIITMLSASSDWVKCELDYSTITEWWEFYRAYWWGVENGRDISSGSDLYVNGDNIIVEYDDKIPCDISKIIGLQFYIDHSGDAYIGKKASLKLRNFVVGDTATAETILPTLEDFRNGAYTPNQSDDVDTAIVLDPHYLDYLADADPLWTDTLALNYTVNVDTTYKVFGLKDVLADSVSHFWYMDSVFSDITYYSNLSVGNNELNIDFEKIDSDYNWQRLCFIWAQKQCDTNSLFGEFADTLGGQILDFKYGVNVKFDYKLELINDPNGDNNADIRFDFIDTDGHVSIGNPIRQILSPNEYWSSFNLFVSGSEWWDLYSPQWWDLKTGRIDKTQSELFYDEIQLYTTDAKDEPYNIPCNISKIAGMHLYIDDGGKAPEGKKANLKIRNMVIGNEYLAESFSPSLAKKKCYPVKDFLKACFTYKQEGDTLRFSSDCSNLLDGISYEYEWDFGDGATSNEKNPSHNYNTYGTYAVVLTISSSDGNIHSFSSDVEYTMPDIDFDSHYLDYLADADPLWTDTLAKNYTVNIDTTYKIIGLKDVFADSVASFWNYIDTTNLAGGSFYNNLSVKDNELNISFEKKEDISNWQYFDFNWSQWQCDTGSPFGLNADTLGGQIVDFKTGVEISFEYELDIYNNPDGEEDIRLRIDLVDADGHVSDGSSISINLDESDSWQSINAGGDPVNGWRNDYFSSWWNVENGRYDGSLSELSYDGKQVSIDPDNNSSGIYYIPCNISKIVGMHFYIDEDMNASLGKKANLKIRNMVIGNEYLAESFSPSLAKKKCYPVEDFLKACFTYKQEGDTLRFSSDCSNLLDGISYEYVWDFGDGTVSYDKNPSFKYNTYGIYTVTLTVSSPDGNTHSFSLDVEFHSPEIDYDPHYLDYLADADPLWTDTLAQYYTVNIDTTNKVIGLKDVLTDSASKFWYVDTVNSHLNTSTIYKDFTIENNELHISYERYGEEDNWQVVRFIWAQKQCDTSNLFGKYADTLGGQVVDFKMAPQISFDYKVVDFKLESNAEILVRLIDANGHVGDAAPVSYTLTNGSESWENAQFTFPSNQWNYYGDLWWNVCNGRLLDYSGDDSNIILNNEKLYVPKAINIPCDISKIVGVEFVFMYGWDGVVGDSATFMIKNLTIGNEYLAESFSPSLAKKKCYPIEEYFRPCFSFTQENDTFAFNSDCSLLPLDDEYTFSWDFGDGTVSNEENPMHVYDYYSKYEVELSISSSKGTKAYASTIAYQTPEDNAIVNTASAFTEATEFAGYVGESYSVLAETEVLPLLMKSTGESDSIAEIEFGYYASADQEILVRNVVTNEVDTVFLPKADSAQWQIATVPVVLEEGINVIEIESASDSNFAFDELSVSHSETVIAEATSVCKSFEQGWNLISVNLIPETSNLRDSALMEGLIQVVKNDTVFWNRDYPEYLNSLHEIENGESYFIYFNEPTETEFHGYINSYLESGLHELKQGWNLVGVENEEDILPYTLFMKYPNLTQIKDDDNFITRSGNGSLQELEVGKAYLFYIE